MLIAFPPCTYLTKAANARPRTPERERKTIEALGFVDMLLNAPVPRIALENPSGRISTAIRKPDQIVHPYMFGSPWSKMTCLWLKGLPKLEATNLVEPIGCHVGKDVRYGGLTLAEARSLTDYGLANAMGEQWGEVIMEDRITSEHDA
jgi:hypothetical protein